MYSFDSRVRYSEVDYRGRITPMAVLDYFQDCSSFQSEELEIGLKYLTANGIAWVLTSWQIEIARYPLYGERITVGTWPYDLRGFLGYRCFEMKDGGGARVACARSMWALLDTATGKPARIPALMAERYVTEPAIPMEVGPRKMRLPEGMEEREPFLVHRFHLDTNQHVNNGKYVLMAQEYLPESFDIGRIRVEYRKSAVYGDAIYPMVKEQGQKVTVALRDGQQNAYAVLEIERMGENAG